MNSVTVPFLAIGRAGCGACGVALLSVALLWCDRGVLMGVLLLSNRHIALFGKALCWDVGCVMCNTAKLSEGSGSSIAHEGMDSSVWRVKLLSAG